MKSKSIFFAAMRHRYLGIFIPLLILFSFVCYFSQIQLSSYMELNYLLTANSNMQVFLFYIPMLLILLLPINTILENELLYVRCKSCLHAYLLKVKNAFLLASFIIVIKLMIEIIFAFITNSQWAIFASPYYFLIYIIQLGTVFFTFTVYFLFRQITKNSALSVLMYLFLFGLDFLLSMQPINGIFFELNLFCTPMCLTFGYIESLFSGNPPNYLFHLFYMVSKIMAVLIFTCILMNQKRRRKLA